MGDDADGVVKVSADRARDFVRALFVSAGVDAEAAALVAEGLIEADLQGAGSHGLLQAPNYLRRVRAGTISRTASLRLVHSSGAITVFDAGLALGHAVAPKAMEKAVASASIYGIAAVAIRAATHFGVAGRHVRAAAEAGLIGIAMCNSRVMLPAPGGTRPLVGNNPLAIAVPAAGRSPIVFDMAMSAAAMGKIRLAARRGESIPEGWALDSDGQPTTDAAAAIRGMLQPAAGAKGFGLALVINLLCALSGGSAGGEVAPMYGEPSAPSDCSWLLIAIDPAHFGLSQPHAQRVAELAEAMQQLDPNASFPGDRKLEAERRSGGMIAVPRALVEDLERLSIELNGPAGLREVV